MINMKKKANKCLSMVAAAFIMTAILKYMYSDNLLVEMLFKTTIAALVGGIADWFAVTALFERPLGFPWHTALIPRSREKIINAIAKMIEQELLSVNLLKRKIDNYDVTKWLINWIEKGNGKLVINNIMNFLWEHLDKQAICDYLLALSKKGLMYIELMPQMKVLASYALQNENYEKLGPLVDKIISFIETANGKALIYNYMKKNAENKYGRFLLMLGKETDIVNLRDAADSIYKELIKSLSNAKYADSFVHKELKELVNDLTTQENSRLELKFKAALAHNPELQKLIMQVLKDCVENKLSWQELLVMLPITENIEKIWQDFLQDVDSQAWLEARIKQLLYQLITDKHEIIGDIVISVLENFSDQELNQFIEEKAGEDLEWIRINGSVVGGITGLTLFLVMHFIYQPVIRLLIK